MKKCPICGLINPDTAEICDCGYNLKTAAIGKSFLPKRTLGGILKETFKICGRNFLKLFVIVAIVQVVPLGVFLLVAWPQAAIPAGEIGIEGLGRLTEYLTLFIPMWIILLVYLIVLLPLMYGALIHAVSERSLGKMIGIGRAYGFAWGRRGALIGAALLAGLALVGMSITIIGIPFAVYFGVRWTFICQAVLLEGVSARAALSRSSNVVKENWGRVLGIMFVAGIIAAVVGAVLGIIPVVGGIIGGILSTSILIIAETLLYYDLRVRKERYDVETLSKELGI